MNFLMTQLNLIPNVLNNHINPTLLVPLQDFRIKEIITGAGLLNDFALHQSYNSKFSKYNRGSKHFAACNERISKAKEQIFACPDAQKLWDEIEEEGSFTLKCTSQEEAPAGALVWIERREILFSETLDELVNPLIFELNNLKQGEMLALIGDNKCRLGLDEFAKATEAAEYNTAKNTHTIFQKCFDNGFWAENLSKYQDEFSGKGETDWNSFKGYLATQEKYGHTDLYRMDWYNVCNPKGLKKWMEKNTDKWNKVLEESTTKKEL